MTLHVAAPAHRSSIEIWRGKLIEDGLGQVRTHHDGLIQGRKRHANDLRRGRAAVARPHRRHLRGRGTDGAQRLGELRRRTRNVGKRVVWWPRSARPGRTKLLLRAQKPLRG